MEPLSIKKKMFPLQTYPSHYNNNRAIIDESIESSLIASPNQRNNHPQPPLPIIKIPFPPCVNPEDLILKPRKAKSKLPTKPPNAFIIYRIQYVKELHERNYRLPMRNVSASIASAWRDEPNHIVEYYKEIAREASKIYNQYYSKRSVVGKPPVQRRRSGLINLTSTPLLENLNGHNDRNRSTTLVNHSLAQDDERPPLSYVSYNHHIVHKCRNRRLLRHGFKHRDTLIQITRLPPQVTNNRSIYQFFNGLPF